MNKFAVLEQLKTCLSQGRAFAAGLVGELAASVTAAITELEGVKADKPEGTTLTIPASGWQNDSSNTSYPKYYDIAAAGVTAKDKAEIVIAAGSLSVARDCGLCPTNETMAGKIRIRAASVPTAAMTGECWLAKGKE